MARTRSVTRNVMNRAWNIAKNSMNRHNSDAGAIAKNGACRTVVEFFAEALKLAWKEEQTGQTLFQKVAGIPKKVMPRINTALRQLLDTNPYATRVDMVHAALVARYGQDKVSPEMIEQHFQSSLV